MSEDHFASQPAVEPVRRPLLGIVFCYLAGTCAGVWIICPHFLIGLVLAFLGLFFAFGLHLAGKLSEGGDGIFPQSRGIRFVFRVLPGLVIGLVCFSIFLAGWLAINLHLNSPSGRDLSALMDRPREGVEIIGIVTDDPALRQGGRDDSLYWSFSMRVEALCRVGFFQKARGEVLVTMPQNENGERPSYGERWRLTGVLIDKAFSSFAGAHRPDLVKNLIPYRFSFQVDRQSAGGQSRLTKAPPWSILRWCFSLRQKCADTLARGIAHRPDVVGILHALILGRQYELPAGLRAAFAATGTYHIFAISGQHVAIIAMFVVVVLQVYGVCRLNWFYFLAPVLIVFTIMAGMSASAVRGCVMALMCFLAPMFKRKTDISSAMALAALLIVGADPMQLFQAGFILSFGIVAGLIVLCPPLIAFVERRIASDPYRLEPENRPARNARSVIRWVLFMVTASFAAWLVSTPLIARWFNLVSLTALPANLFVIPMATLVLLAGCLSIVSGLFCPFIAEVFNFANVFFVSLMAGLTRALAQVPLGHIFVRSPPLWFVGLWLGVLVVWRIYYQKTKIWLSAVLVLFIIGASAWLAQKKAWEIHVLNIDQCAVCLVNTDKGKNLLINAGPRYQARNIIRYLRKTGVNSIQTLVCPFPDAKHIGAAKEIIAALPVGRIWRGEKKPRKRLLNELCLEAEKKRIGMGELTNEVWRVQSGRNGWNIGVVGGRNCGAQYQGENFPANCSNGPLSILINTGVQTQMTARIWIRVDQPPSAIVVEETPLSGFRSGARIAAPAEAQCRIFCCPANDDRDRNYRGQSSDFQPPARIALGPGEGVLILPDKEGIKMRAITIER